jgi:hypothetical protein
VRADQQGSCKCFERWSELRIVARGGDPGDPADPASADASVGPCRAAGADKSIKNKQDKVPIDMCEPVWSTAWKYTREVLAN